MIRHHPEPPAPTPLEQAIERAVSPAVEDFTEISLLMETALVQLAPGADGTLQIPERSPAGPHLLVWVAGPSDGHWRGVRLPPGSRWRLSDASGAPPTPALWRPGMPQ